MRGGTVDSKPSERRDLEHAIVRGLPKAPAWVRYMEVGELMGIKPWRLVGGSRLLWYARYEVVREMRIKAAKKEKNKPSDLDSIDARQRRNR